MNQKKPMLLKVLVVLLVAALFIPYTAGAAYVKEWVEAYVAKDFKITWNGEKYRPTEEDGSPVYPIVHNGRTYLPVRYVAEKTGLDVQWDGSTKTIKIDDGKGSSNGNGEEDTTIRVLTSFAEDDPFTDVWEKAIQNFMVQNPHVKIVNDAVPAADDLFLKRVYSDFDLGNEPDVCFAFTRDLAQPLIDSGLLYTWDEELNWDAPWASSFIGGAIDFDRHSDGKLYSIPFLGYSEGMYYNQALFDQYNVKVPTNYQELVNAVHVFKSKGIVPIAASFMEEPHYLIETFILSLEGAGARSTLFDSSWVSALNYIKELYEMGAFAEDVLYTKSSWAKELFANEEAAMMIEGSWSERVFSEMGLSDRVAMSPVPLLPGAKAHPRDIIGGFGSGWYVSRHLNEVKKDVPVEFVKYMTSPEVVEQFCQVTGYPAVECNFEGDSLLKQSMINMFRTANSISSPVDQTIGRRSWGMIYHNVYKIVTGEKTAQSVVEEAKRIYEQNQ